VIAAHADEGNIVIQFRPHPLKIFNLCKERPTGRRELIQKRTRMGQNLIAELLDLVSRWHLH
jgi:hypothetical protein